MVRLWLAVGCLVALASPARANRIACVQKVPIQLPRPTDAPTFDTFEPGKSYTYRGRDPVVRFSGQPATDTTPPAPPQIAELSLVLDEADAREMPVDALRLSAQLDTDVVMLRIVLVDGAGNRLGLLTPPDPYLCRPGLAVSPRVVTISVSAIDRAGNESAPTTTDVYATILDAKGHVVESHVRCGMGAMGLYIVGGMLLVGGALSFIVIVLLRRALRPRGEPEPISLLVAESIARSTLRTAILGTTVLLGGAAAFAATDHEIFASLTALLGLPSLLTMVSARLLLGRLEHKGATAQLLDKALLVTDERGRCSRVNTSYRAIRNAFRSSVPTTVVR